MEMHREESFILLESVRKFFLKKVKIDLSWEMCQDVSSEQIKVFISRNECFYKISLQCTIS